MTQHEFGIMERTPVHEEYGDYDRWHYAYISVDDDLISPLHPQPACLDSWKIHLTGLKRDCPAEELP